MHREKDLFPRVIDFGNLSRAFLAASRGKRRRATVQAFEHDLEPHLWQIRRELEAGEYRWGPYGRFVFHDSKRREVRVPPFRDRVVHHALYSVLHPVFARGFIADSYACLAGRGSHAAVCRYRDFVRGRRGAGFVLQGDIHHYYASVDHEVLRRLLARRIGDERVLALLASLIDHGTVEPGRGMPLGNLTSVLFANLYLDRLDHFVKECLRVRQYIRYMDDFVLCLDGREEARARLGEIEAFLAERLHVRLNPRRVVIAPLSAPRDFLGYVHFPGGRTRLRRRTARRLWRRLLTLEERLEAGRIEWASVRASLASWHGHARYADTFRLSRAIFGVRDVRNLGKRLLVAQLGDCRTERTATSPSATGATGPRRGGAGPALPGASGA